MKKAKSNFKGKLVESYKRKKEEKGNFGYLTLKDVEMLKLPEGARSFTLDFLPYIVSSEKHVDRDNENEMAMPGTQWYRSVVKVHKNVGADNESVVCPTTIGKKCPICEYRVKRIKEGADKEEFKVLYPQERSIYPVIPLEKGFEQVPMLWDMSDFLFQNALMEELAENEDNEDFFTLENGKTATLRIRWKEFNKNKFPEIVSIDFEDRDPYEEEILEEVPDIDSMLKILSYEEIFAKFFNEEISDDEIEEEEEEPVRNRRASRTAPKEEEEEEEEAPVRRSKKQEEVSVSRRSRKVEQEEDEDVDEKPVQRQRRVTKDESDVIKEKEPVRTRGKKTSSNDGDKCPFGHKFGVDTDEYKDCERCELWDECDEEKEAKGK
jgi:hypothetical protein